ncbi:hypothetical protein SOVF_210160, partial [Spinacia oleracea]
RNSIFVSPNPGKCRVAFSGVVVCRFCFWLQVLLAAASGFYCFFDIAVWFADLLRVV